MSYSAAQRYRRRRWPRVLAIVGVTLLLLLAAAVGVALWQAPRIDVVSPTADAFLKSTRPTVAARISGIGGVHDVETLDISTDLQALSDTPMIVVCAGAKAILDLPATLEYLETMAVPVIGYKTDEFPGFYSRQSGLPVSARLDSPEEVVIFTKTHWELGMKGAVLVCQPLSSEEEIPRHQVEGAIVQARWEAHEKGIRGQELTPFLLSRMAELTEGASLKANLSLLLNNARLAAQISKEFWRSQEKKV